MSTPIPTPLRLSNDDSCRLMGFYLDRYETPSFTPKEILWEACQHGLTSTADDYGRAAADFAMELATSKNIETSETDLLALAEHIAALAEMVVWVCRTGAPWRRPDDKRLPTGPVWRSGAFLTPSEAQLRYLVCVDRWDEMREMELKNSWQIAGESAVYQAPVETIIVEIGPMRNGRWSNPLTMGYRHPVAKDLRFRRRDGEAFGPTWTKVWRFEDQATREDWLDAVTEDGVLSECVHALSVEIPTRWGSIEELAIEKLVRIEMQGEEPPEQQPSRCFDRIRPCVFRGCCPHGKTPASEGFTERREVPAHDRG